MRPPGVLGAVRIRPYNWRRARIFIIIIPIYVDVPARIQIKTAKHLSMK
jgi:hypothetical protein